MRRACLATLLAAATCAVAAEPTSPVAGVWLGKVKAGTATLRLAFKIDAGKDGAIVAKLVSLDQGRAEVPAKTAAFADGKLELDWPNLQAKFSGTLDKTGRKLAGEFTQGGAKMPLTLDRVDSLPEVKRPQHPKPPYPYAAEEVWVRNEAADFNLAGTLTLPPGSGPFPAVVLVTGSGPQDRDETIMDHKPFLVLADHLTRAGVAVLRCDDRGIGKSGGRFHGATTADFATDAWAGVQFLRGRKEIDPKRVGVCGHSEGGMVGPLVAAAHPAEVAFVVMLAGPGLTGTAILRAQNHDIAKLAKSSADEVKALMGFLDAVLPLAADAKVPAEKLKEAVDAAADAAAKSLPEAVRTEVRAQLKPMGPALADPWMRHFLAFDPAPVLKRVKCPVLAVWGAKDVQVRAKENLAAVQAALKEGGNPAVTVKEFPVLNHLFQKCTTGAVGEYGIIEETMNPEVLKTVAEWMVKVK